MEDQAPVDLIHLSDGQDVSLILRAVGPPPSRHGPVPAECLVTADFVTARLETHIWPDLLDEWEEALARLGAGEGAGWPQGSRGLVLYFHPEDSGWLSPSVHDPDRLTVALGLEPPPGWLEEHEIRLRRLREVYELA